MSIVALSAALDGMVSPAVGKRANETRLFRHRTRASLADTKMLGHGEPEDASTGKKCSFSRFHPGHGSAGARIEQSGQPALVERRSTKGGYSNG